MEHRGSLSFVFNAHLPYVKSHSNELGKLTERWLFDALVWSYIPFIESLKHIVEKGCRFKVGLSLSPTLLSMLTDGVILDNFEHYLNASIILGEKEHKRLKNAVSSQLNKKCSELAIKYREHYLNIKHLFKNTYNRDIIEQWRKLEELGCIELLTTSGTYAFLPNFRNSKGVIHAQIKNGLRTFESITRTSTPKGFWLPECGYFEGLEDDIAEFGFDYSFCDTRAVIYADDPAPQGIFNPVYSRNENVLFFPRDSVLSNLVWSSKTGYIANQHYRDFHKDIGDEVSLDYLAASTRIKNVRLTTGYKYYSNASVQSELEVYDEEKASEQIVDDVDSFMAKVSRRVKEVIDLGVKEPICTLLFDLDLFGKRWFEGLDWFQQFVEKVACSDQKEVQLVSPSQYLSSNKDTNYSSVALSFSSWSEKGYAQVWLDESNKYLYRDLFRCIALFNKLVNKIPTEHMDKRILLDRIIQQAGRELLLAQSSDWPFILHANKFNNYVNREVYVHIQNFNKLYHMLVSKEIDFTFVHSIEQHNKIFDKFDYSMFEFGYAG